MWARATYKKKGRSDHRPPRHCRLSIHVAAQPLALADRQELLEGACFELANALAAHAIPPAHFFECQRLIVAGPEPQAKDIGLARRQLAEGGLELRAQVACRCLTLGIVRSEEHTSELQSHVNLVCRLL